MTAMTARWLLGGAELRLEKTDGLSTVDDSGTGGSERRRPHYRLIKE